MTQDITLQNGKILHIDSRDIALPSDLRREVWVWAHENNISLEGHLYGVEGLDVWRVRDDQQRVWFNLRWR